MLEVNCKQKIVLKTRTNNFLKHFVPISQKRSHFRLTNKGGDIIQEVISFLIVVFGSYLIKQKFTIFFITLLRHKNRYMQTNQLRKYLLDCNFQLFTFTFSFYYLVIFNLYCRKKLLYATFSELFNQSEQNKQFTNVQHLLIRNTQQF